MPLSKVHIMSLYYVYTNDSQAPIPQHAPQHPDSVMIKISGMWIQYTCRFTEKTLEQIAMRQTANKIQQTIIHSHNRIY